MKTYFVKLFRYFFFCSEDWTADFADGADERLPNPRHPRNPRFKCFLSRFEEIRNCACPRPTRFFQGISREEISDWRRGSGGTWIGPLGIKAWVGPAPLARMPGQVWREKAQRLPEAKRV